MAGPPEPMFPLRPSTSVEADRRPHAGRPTIRTEVNERRILENIENGMPQRWAAIEAGVSEGAFYEWMQASPQFAEAVKSARSRRMRKLVKHVMDAAPANWAAAMTALERLEPEDFGKRDRVRHEHAGTVGLTIQPLRMDAEAISHAAALEEAMSKSEDMLALPSHDDDDLTTGGGGPDEQ